MSGLDIELARRFVPRPVWGARTVPPTRYSRLEHPSFGVTVHYEGPELGAYAHLRCPSIVRGIQSFHMDGRGWIDVAYSDLVCRHGFIFEGRGPGRRTAANGTNAGNSAAYATCAIVGEHDDVPETLIVGVAVSAARLNRYAGRTGLNGHRDWKPTACPGDPLYAHLGVLRDLVAGYLDGSPPPAPPPHPGGVVVAPISFGPVYSEEPMALRRYLVPVPIRGHRGYADLLQGVGGLPATVPAEKVLAYGYGGDDPGDGWGPKATAPVELVNVGGVARIVVPGHEVTDGNISVYVTVAV